MCDFPGFLCAFFLVILVAETLLHINVVFS